MARVTVEDCLDNLENRFELVLVAAKRARQISMGREPLVELENDKPTVVALREISEGLIDSSILDEAPEVREERFEEMAEEQAEAVGAEAEEMDVAAAIKAALSAELGSESRQATADESGLEEEGE